MKCTILYLSANHIDGVLKDILNTLGDDEIRDNLLNDMIAAADKSSDGLTQFYAIMEVKSKFIAKHIGASSSLPIAAVTGSQYQFDFHDSNAAIAFKLKYDHVYELD